MYAAFSSVMTIGARLPLGAGADDARFAGRATGTPSGGGAGGDHVR